MPYRAHDQHLTNGQVLRETWEIEFVRPRFGVKHEARLMTWGSTTHYLCVGKGDSVEEARYDLVAQLARAIADDENPYGDDPPVSEEEQHAQAESEIRERIDDLVDESWRILRRNFLGWFS